MSRVEFNSERWRLVVGVDHVTSSFMQVWAQPASSRDEALIVIDNQGVRENPTWGESGLWPESMNAERQKMVVLLKKTARLYELARDAGNQYPNLDGETVCKFAEILGFPGTICREIYRALD